MSVCVCRGEASLQPREGHLSISAPLILKRVAAVRVCLSGVLLNAIPGQCLIADLESHHASVQASVILMLSVTLPVCPCVLLSMKKRGMLM